MNTIHIRYYQSPAGELILGSTGDRLCLCDWRYRSMREAIDQRIRSGLEANFAEGNDAVLEQAAGQLEDYFIGGREIFDLPLVMVGSAFQKKVWQALLEIPFGTTVSYLELSGRLGDPKAIRAVAAANGANALAIIVPCHRVIGSNGKLTGYAGGLAAKRKLLRLEATHPEQLELF